MSNDQPVRLYCFGHSAEGASVFDGWAAHVGAGVEPVPVFRPGSGVQHDERRVTTRDALLADLLPQFTAPQPGPYVLYGHGLGAMIALTVARAVHEAGLPGPALLAVGAWPAPYLPAGLADARSATDAELLHVLSGKGAVPASSDEGIWLRATLPVLRADLELAQDLHAAAREPSPAGRLTTPVLVVDSQENLLVPPATADGCQWTDGPVWSRTVPGRHFFVRGGRELPRLLGRACRVARRLTKEPAPVG
ncbi:thioesterase domain-containing protein [Streptomyces sp. MZ04]|uniref:thioesterase II family protein n=1 Tax=Streptomyces sp. MZ04 TaxID=2559236 RepID=UPI00107ED7DE|nr:thioesterase domain-containing protein [Streptomyces sp. MZ04]TGA99664.1 thioesterase [Streptomyces sp. MZ04]